MPLPITGGPLLLPEPELDPDPELLELDVLPPELVPPDTEPELLPVLPLLEWDPLPPPASELLRAPLLDEPLPDPLLDPPREPLPDPAADPLLFALLPLEVLLPAALGDVLVPPVLPDGKPH